MSVAAHQERNENKNREKRQATNFEESECCLSATVEWATRQKNN